MYMDFNKDIEEWKKIFKEEAIERGADVNCKIDHDFEHWADTDLYHDHETFNAYWYVTDGDTEIVEEMDIVIDDPDFYKWKEIYLE